MKPDRVHQNIERRLGRTLTNVEAEQIVGVRVYGKLRGLSSKETARLMFKAGLQLNISN